MLELQSSKVISENDNPFRDFCNACVCPGCWDPYVTEIVTLHKPYRNQFLNCCDSCYEELKDILKKMGFTIIGRKIV